ncbi:probable CCR4-associated factor 1 homolog 11 [Punica granatum]|uniref:poly(A)-specific ribonuclease n=1 Tax=Punica granatum TaxID=22663 RepID=A0A6P8DZ82_PUNGR|nr:probable CCR4-associated factor 1 homolog 11 [Punica granatum]
MEIAGPVIVREVWAHNLEKEFALIRVALPGCRIAAIDTEFPGHIFKSQVDGHLIARLPPAETYELMKSNIDALEIIQVGLALSDSCGRLPHFGTPFSYVWQFNFQDFDIETNAYNEESINLLKSQGIDFSKNREMGISSHDFVRQLFLSGLICGGRPISWKRFFGFCIYDVKHMIKSCDGLYGGLERVAKSLNVDRIAGKSHQAGSDSLLTLQTFFKLIGSRKPFTDNTEGMALFRFCSVLFGLEAPMQWRCSGLLFGSPLHWDNFHAQHLC